VQDFRRLKVWQKGHALTLDVYKATVNFPKEEVYGLASQLRRASSSIPANIAEGCGYRGDTQLVRFMQIAMGSASEVEYHLLLAKDLGFLKYKLYEQLQSATTEVKRMLSSFIATLKPAKTERLND
jgi:four helix bundle protein